MSANEPTLFTILVVDDDPVNILILNQLLQKEYTVYCATTGLDALAAVATTPPDLILLDVMMPGLDGFEVCRALKANPETADLPVIFLTTLPEAETIAAGFTLGAVDYIVKPCNAIELNARVKTHLQVKKAKAELVQKNAELIKTQGLLQSQQLQLVAQNRNLEERVAAGVKLCRNKDQALMQNEKMVSLGQLAAGVAHEINNPMGYISSNLSVLAQYFDQIIGFDQIRQELDFGELTPSVRESIVARRMTLGIDTILEDGVDLIKESLEGAERVAKIVRNLKNFSRMDALECEPVALSSCLESALTIVHNELKYVATIRNEFESQREVLGHPGQLSQVFLNLLVNAGQAIDSSTLGEIVLRSWHDDAFVYASVGDTGSGMSEEIKDRIFDPFFTTKEVGNGTGLGLSISSDIITKHHGEILVVSVVGVGTTFTVKLPRTPEET